MKNTVYTITTEAKRTLQELFTPSTDPEAGIDLFHAVNSPNFHFLDIELKEEYFHVEALRNNPYPNEHFAWEYPVKYRVTGTHRTPEIIQRGYKGENMQKVVFLEMPFFTLNHIRILQHPTFILLTYRVGRMTKTVKWGEM